MTGGCAVGKSTVRRLFEDQGVYTIDADLIAKELLDHNSVVRAQVETRFKTLDRKQLREIIFMNSQSDQAKKDLEAILHPLIQAEFVNQLSQLPKKTKLVIYEASLLIESSSFPFLNGLVVVNASLEKRQQRIISRDHISLEMAHVMIASQMDAQTMMHYADYIIENDGDQKDLQEQVVRCFHQLVKQ